MDRIVKGWMREDERMALRRWAFGLNVLEIGPYEGLSTMQLASTAEHVCSVDTFDGRGTPEPRNTEAEFHATLRACGMTEVVTVFKGESAHVVPKMEAVFGMVLIDGAHDYDSVRTDAELSRKVLKPGGFLAFHDYDAEHPDVVRVVDALRHDGMTAVEQANSLVLLKEGGKIAQQKINIALLLPHRDGWAHMGACQGAFAWATKKYSHKVYNCGTSILTKTFNDLLCSALNDREAEQFTHVAMLHNDVVPSQYWLDKAVEELEVNRLDCLQVVVPLKDDRGLTSTGINSPDNPWGVRRLTLHEIFKLPETFRAEDVPWRHEGQGLLLNSGCWVMRFDKPWTRGLHFRQQDRIVFHIPSQRYVPESISEDWDFSRQLLSRGCRLGATRAIGVEHQFSQFHTRHAWGRWETDEQWFDDLKNSQEAEAELATA